MADFDSDVALNDEISRNSNHDIVLNSESLWNANNNDVRHPNRSRQYRQGAHSKHRLHHGRNKTGSSYHDTDEYFELARQARLLSKDDEMPGNSFNDPNKHAVLERKNVLADRGKEVDHTGEAQLNGSRFQWSKPFRNQKNKQALVGSSSTCNGRNSQRKLVRNGCISPNNVSQFGRMSRHNACPSGRSTEHDFGVTDKGKGKIGLSSYSGPQKSERGVMLHESREASTCNEIQLGSNQRRNYLTGKRKQRVDQPNLGESSNHSENLTIANSFGEESRERDSCNEEYWSVEEPNFDNEELADQTAKVNQVESDEILARRLQEQFNQEARYFLAYDEEDGDAIIARALQEEDDDDDYNDHDIMPFRRNSRQGSSLQIPRRTQTRFNGPDMDYEMLLISQLRRGLDSSHMDIETRLSIWEALEDVFGNQTDMDISGDISQGFHDNEYEILSALDEDNHQHAGAADDRVEDACVICLEDPAVGDAMRHLPCLHRFHKECIDKWLRRKNACPVCKSSIN